MTGLWTHDICCSRSRSRSRSVPLQAHMKSTTKDSTNKASRGSGGGGWTFLSFCRRVTGLQKQFKDTRMVVRIAAVSMVLCTVLFSLYQFGFTSQRESAIPSPFLMPDGDADQQAEVMAARDAAQQDEMQCELEGGRPCSGLILPEAGYRFYIRRKCADRLTMSQCECSVNDTRLGQVLSRAAFASNVCICNFVRRSPDDGAVPPPQVRWTMHLSCDIAAEDAQPVIADSVNKDDSTIAKGAE